MNPLAKEEYEEEKERLEELATQRQDLEASLAEIEKLRDELAETVQRRFDRDVRDAWRATSRRSRRRSSRAARADSASSSRTRRGSARRAEAGIEVELRPAGKRITRLTLLSGGEKALGAISFLFALFLAKPCPFYLLDEVEAALDDANVSRFVELLRRYADRAQFIVITHQKRTMEAADVLYGVTMGGDGVSRSSRGGCRSTIARRRGCLTCTPGAGSVAACPEPGQSSSATSRPRPTSPSAPASSAGCATRSRRAAAR